MDICNETPFVDGLAIGMGPDRQACLSVLVKATFALPKPGEETPAPAGEQWPIVAADEYFKGDITGSVEYEADAVPFKPRADVVLIGKAHAPGGRPVKALDAMLRVGRLRKVIRVFGDRKWIFPTRLVMVPVISEPEPFTEMPLVYERAFGGFDRKAAKWCAHNYIGKGFLGKKSKESVDGKPLPNLEDPHRLIQSWDDEPMPVGFGFYSKNTQPRAAFAGTQKGLEAPHEYFGLAADFKHDFFNGAYPDLQVSGYLNGDEEVEMVNLTPDGPHRFRLPGVRPVITLHTYVDAPEPAFAGDADMPERATQATALDAVLDTLVFSPEEGVFCQVWRARRSLRDIETDIENIARIEIKSIPVRQ